MFQIIAYSILLLHAAAAAVKGYDEAYDERGQPRPAYKDFVQQKGFDALRPTDHVRDQLLGSPLGDSQKALPVPLILDQVEDMVLRDGVVQRAAVYRALFHDVVMGDQRIFREKGALFRALITDLFRRQNTSLAFLRNIYRGHPISQVRFIYAPDLVREPNGFWTVLEDHVGPAPGGLGDQDMLRLVYEVTSGAKLLHSNLVHQLMTAFVEQTNSAADTTVALHAVPTEVSLDHRDDEAKRVSNAIESSGLRSIRVTNTIHPGQLLGARALIAFADLQTLMTTGGYLAVAQEVRARRVELFETLGLEALCDKSLLPYMNELARFYLKEDLRLRSPTTVGLTSGAQVRGLGSGADDLVIKAVRGRAGSEVYFWSDLDDHQRQRLTNGIDRVVGQSEIATGFPLAPMVGQRTVVPSHLPTSGSPGASRARVDVRVISYVGPSRVVTPAFFWGRAATVYGDRRQNVSRGALQLVVLPSCGDWLTKVDMNHTFPDAGTR